MEVTFCNKNNNVHTALHVMETTEETNLSKHFMDLLRLIYQF